MALIHQWKLTTDATDSVGGLAITNNGGVTFSPANGAGFNGSNQWLSFTKSLIPSSEFSMSIWIKCKDITSGNNGYLAPFGSCDSNGSYRTGFQFNYQLTKIYGIYGNTFSAGSNTDFTPINYPLSLFTMITLTYSNNVSSLYRNDILVAQGSSNPQLIDSAWAIGRFGSFADLTFSGNLLDARMYSHALTITEITSLVSAGANGGASSTPPQCYAGGI